MLRRRWVQVDAMHHANVAHVLNTADDEDITLASHDLCRCSVQCLHR